MNFWKFAFGAVAVVSVTRLVRSCVEAHERKAAGISKEYWENRAAYDAEAESRGGFHFNMTRNDTEEK